MHPGNILVRGKSSKRLFKSKPHVIFLDVGMTAELSGSDRVNLLEFFKSVARRDGRTAAECALSLSKKQNCPNPQAFIEVIAFFQLALLIFSMLSTFSPLTLSILHIVMLLHVILLKKLFVIESSNVQFPSAKVLWFYFVISIVKTYMYMMN
jgi:hypothetical protein